MSKVADYKRIDRLMGNTPLESFFEYCQALVATKRPEDTLVLYEGKKYYKIVNHRSNGQKSVWGFVDIQSGDILKAASFNKPAAKARGNIHDADNGKNAVEWTGPKYLR